MVSICPTYAFIGSQYTTTTTNNNYNNNQHILNDRKKRRKYLAMVWIDYKKAFHMVCKAGY